MELAIINNNIKVRDLSEEKLNEFILTHFIDWLSGLLSLTGDTSSERLEFALPAIKEHCWSMGLTDIKEMFEMYADGKLDVDPIPNYFDRIIFGKIAKSYRKLKKVKPPTVNPEEVQKAHKENQDLIYCITAFDHYIQTNKLPEESYWLYSYLVDKKRVVEFDEKTRINEYNLKFEKLKDKEKSIIESKISLIKKYFDSLHAKGKHIKDCI